MTDSPSFDVDFAVSPTPSAADPSVSLDVLVNAVVPLPAVRLEVDAVSAGVALELRKDASGFHLVPAFHGPDGPAGAAVSVELPGVTGGGQLLRAGDEWRGAMTLQFASLKVTGYGLLGSDPQGDVSMLIVLSVRFPDPGIQVGFGFAVSGVGGIFGVNRRTDPQAITAAVQDGSLGNLLFPEDPEHDIETVLAHLPALFPSKDDQAVFGPMLEISWGSGLLKVQAALIVEAPDPLRISLIGRLVVDLPASGDAVVHIQATFAAIIDLSVPEFRVVASLTGSNIIGIVLTGDLFLLIRGGPDATFVLSVGGFHPAVQPPPGVPALQRVGMAMSVSIAELRFESYFAVTTCSVQFGAKAELTASVADCGLHGGFSFDALVEWIPRFYFRVDVNATVEVEAFGETLLGVRLSGMLEGPAPFHLVAHGEVDILFVSVSFEIDQRFGEAPKAIPVAVPDVADELIRALEDSSAWTLHPPSADNDGVVLSADAAAAVAAGTLFHPAGSLQVRQKLLPFDLTITKFGGAVVPDQRWVFKGIKLHRDAAAGTPDDRITDFDTAIDDQFALGMFQTMSNEQQLSSTAFTQQTCGGVFTLPGIDHGEVRTTDFDWDPTVVGPDLSPVAVDPSSLAVSGTMNLAGLVPMSGRAIDAAWAATAQVQVLTETPTAVVPSTPVVGLVPVALSGPFTTSAGAADFARQHISQGTPAAVVEQWELL
jgi:hypothetical protein